MKSYLSPLLALAGVLAGCSALSFDGPTLATGLVVDAHTLQPIANADVAVGGIYSGPTSSRPHTQTDAQGRFALNCGALNGPTTLYASTPRGYYSQYADCAILKEGYRNDNLTIYTKAPAWVRIVCVDDPPLGQVGLYTSGYDGSGDRQNVGPGNFSFVRPTLSYFSENIYWRLNTQQGQVTEGKLPYTTTAFDTATVTIHF